MESRLRSGRRCCSSSAIGVDKYGGVEAPFEEDFFVMSLRTNRKNMSNLAWILGACGLLWLAGSGDAFAISAVPELDPGSASAGIALAVGAALLLAERYRRR